MSDGAELAVGADAFGDSDRDLEVAVVGAGAVGATAAYDLARQGADVTLYDRGQIASGSSGRAAGICYNAFADDLDAEIGGEAIERFRGLSGDDTFPFVECPYVWLAREGDDRRADAISDQVTRMQTNGVVALEMDADALADRFPALRTDDVAVAGVAGAAGYTDPATYTACLAAAASGAGATLETHTPVEIRTGPPRIVPGGDSGDSREFDAILVAAGAHTKRVLEAAGLSIAMKPYRVQAMTMPLSPPHDGALESPFSEPMCYDATGEFYVRPHPEGLLAGDGTEEVETDPDEWDRDADAGFASDLRARVAHRFPGIGVDSNPGPDAESTRDTTGHRAWAGLCTATPDGDPLVGQLEAGLYVATGFHGHGFMRAPAIGARVAAQILADGGLESEQVRTGDSAETGDESASGAEAESTDESDERLDAFDPTRFTGEEEFEIVEGLVIDERESTD